MEVKTVKISELKPHPKNPRVHPDSALDKLVKSIKEFGWTNPVLCSSDGVVLAGHARLKAAEKAGIKEVPVVYLPLEGAKADAYLIADNKLQEETDWDMPKLTGILKELEVADFDMDLTGFGLTELEDIFGEEKEIIEDEAPELPEEPISKLGDIWQLGKHRVMCGDSTNAESVAELMDGKKAALLHADPPYGMGKENDGVLNDNLYKEKLDGFQMAWWKSFRPHIEDNAGAYIWGNAEDLWRLWYKGGLKDSERLTFRNEIVWDKGNGQGQESEAHRMFPTASERCLFLMLGEQGFNNNADNYWEGWDSVVNYLRQEKEKTGWDVATFKRLAGHSETSGCHWFDKSQWSFPTKEVYNSWQEAAIEHDAFKREHDDLKRDFYATRAYFDNAHDNMTDVWEFKRVTGEERHGHATPKPVEMMARIMKSSLPKDGLCVEPFGGSGSTLIACEQTNRICYMMELDPGYVDVIINRWENFTGQKAELLA